MLTARASLECSLKHLCEGDPPAVYPEFDAMRSYRWISSVRSRIKTQVTRSFSSFIREQLAELPDDDRRLNLETEQAFSLSRFDLALRTMLAPIYPRVLDDDSFRKRVDSQGIKTMFSVTRRNHRLAVTDSGLLGFVPAMSRVDDHVVLFPGGWLPVIIRRSETQDTYQIIGDAFILDLRGKEYERQDVEPVDWGAIDCDALFFHLQDEELTEITLV